MLFSYNFAFIIVVIKAKFKNFMLFLN